MQQLWLFVRELPGIRLNQNYGTCKTNENDKLGETKMDPSLTTLGKGTTGNFEHSHVKMGHKTKL